MIDLEEEVIRLTREAKSLTDEALLDAFEYESCYNTCLDAQEKSLRFYIFRQEALRRMAKGKEQRSES